MTQPSVYYGIDDRIELVVFKNTEKFTDMDYVSEVSWTNNVVYAIYNTTICYMGSVFWIK